MRYKILPTIVLFVISSNAFSQNPTGILTAPRDGQVYKTVNTSEQRLLTENLNSITANQNEIVTEGLVAYFPFSGNAYDGSGNNNNGIVHGATLTSDRFGNPSNAYQFDGVDDYIEIEHSSTLNITEQLTISFWAKLETSAPYYYPYHIIEKYECWGFGQREDDVHWGVTTSNGNFNVWALSLNYNQWYHFVMKYDGSNISIYVDGQFYASEQASGIINTNTNKVYISRYNEGGDYYFDGTLDDFRIYNRALNQSEILELFNKNGWNYQSTSTVTDIDGNVYKTVKIGEQWWMAENLNKGTKIEAITEQTNNDLIEKYCYENNKNYCDTFGGLYQFNEMMQYEAFENSQGICPTGWHIPSDTEWTELSDYLGGKNVAGGAMKEVGFTHWDSPNTGASNESGFTALPGGLLYPAEYYFLGQGSYFWSSTKNETDKAYFRGIGFNSQVISREGKLLNSAFSVRCIKDEGEQVELIELKNDDGTFEGTCRWASGATSSGDISPGRYGFYSILTPESYPFRVTKIRINFGTQHTENKGFYILLWDQNNNDLLPNNILIPPDDIILNQWWEYDLSDYDIEITSGAIKVGYSESYLVYSWPPDNSISYWGVHYDNSSSGKSYKFGYNNYTSRVEHELQDYEHLIRLQGYTNVPIPPFDTLVISPMANNPNYFLKDISNNSSINLYYNIKDGESNPISVYEIKFGLDNSGLTINSTTEFINDTLIKLTINANDLIFDQNNNTTISFNETVEVNEAEVPIKIPPSDILLNLKKQEQHKSYDIFAGGSIGASAILGVGVVASVSAARLTIKGEGGMGLILNYDEQDSLLFTRRFESGVSASLKSPSINTVIDDITTGLNAGIEVEGHSSQTLKFDTYDESDDAKLIKSGFLLESFALSGINLSPLASVVLKAIEFNLSNSNNYSERMSQYLLSTKYGIGVEGSLGLGIESEMLSEYLKLHLIGASTSFNVIADKTDYNKLPNSFSIDIQYGTDFDINTLDFDNDYVVDLKSLFDYNKANMIEYSSFFKDNAIEDFRINYTIGEQFNFTNISELNISEQQFYFTKSALTRVLDNYNFNDQLSFAFQNSFSNPIRIGHNIISSNLNYVLDLATQNYNPEDDPIYINSYESFCQGFDLPLNINLDLALGLGIGFDLGIEIQYLESSTYLKNTSILLSDPVPYEIVVYNEPSFTQYPEFEESIEDLLSGVIPLLKETINGYIGKIETLIEAGKDFIITVLDHSQEIGLSAYGNFESEGLFSIQSNNPQLKRIMQTPFSPPQIKDIYLSHNVVDSSIQKSASIDEQKTLIIISDNYILNLYDEAENPIKDFNSSVELKFILRDSMLLNNDLVLEFKNEVFVYYYDDSLHTWYKIDQDFNASIDTISVTTNKAGSYALGVEYSISLDNTAPEILDVIPEDNAVIYDTLLLSAKIIENELGSGLNLANCFLILDYDTLDATWNPVTRTLFFNFSDELDIGQHSLKVVAEDFNGNSNEVLLTFTKKDIPNNINETPNLLNSDFLIYPNPFNNRVTVKFYTPDNNTDVELFLYNVKGDLIRYIKSNDLSQGLNEIIWNCDNQNGTKVTEGIYFIQLRSEYFNLIKKLIKD